MYIIFVGSLMVIAWIFAVSIGVILPRFYKPMWPESKLFGEKVWFQVGARKRLIFLNSYYVGITTEGRKCFI